MGGLLAKAELQPRAVEVQAHPGAVQASAQVNPGAVLVGMRGIENGNIVHIYKWSF